MTDKEEFFKLLDKYVEGLCSEEEKAYVENWYAHFNEDASRQVLSAETLADVEDRLRSRLSLSRKQSFLNKHRYFAAASVLLVLITLGGILYRYQNNDEKRLVNQAQILPGSNKAVLILADGRSIDLADAPKGNLASQGNTTVSKKSFGEIEFSRSVEDEAKTNNNLQNTISIPRGGQWKLTLNDGSTVWLNSATKLHFPTNFNGNKREVFLEGEGYFEVAKDIHHPFIVHSGNQTLEVLGTSFNINAYSDEGQIQTTLLEGAVKINGSALLKPGQQSLFDGKDTRVANGDIEEAVAWKNGNFIFNNTDLGSIMLQISRWYDVDIKFQKDELKKITFSGFIARSASISTILRRLSLTKEVNFKTEGQTILVLPAGTDK
ncbi:FecR family protein [Pinibacter aurantiacus]|uniref:DUF4974 domain-containing protein n=1 Tax=Pinibacter aurantiacus TaxID=2851599 RepID=A0A9E2W808_9BACT|nr:FecR family protein [Pinibacter aurantiacus]MBV4357287.1 DUF4974 domain-containing protein [Pinibacter aurantiacus]